MDTEIETGMDSTRPVDWNGQLAEQLDWHFEGYDYPGDAATALARLDGSYAAWIEGVRDLYRWKR
jgi:hypothetical protein